MKTYLLWLSLLLCPILTFSQRNVAIDERLQPLLDAFFEQCDNYGIGYHDKLFQLEKIDISNDLPFEKDNAVMGMVTRNERGEINGILINWAAQLDPEILKVVAFHEFAHHFLEHQHTCDDCDDIMAVNNSSYFDVARDWDSQVTNLFRTSPVYLKKQSKTLVKAVLVQNK